MLSAIKEAYRGPREQIIRGLNLLWDITKANLKGIWRVDEKCFSSKWKCFSIWGNVCIHSMNTYQVLLYSCTVNPTHTISFNLHNKLVNYSFFFLMLIQEMRKLKLREIKSLGQDHTGCETGFQLWPVQNFPISVRSRATCYKDLRYYMSWDYRFTEEQQSGKGLKCEY